MISAAEVKPETPETQKEKTPHEKGGLTQAVENIQTLGVLYEIIKNNQKIIERENKARQLSEQLLEKLKTEELADKLINNEREDLNDEEKAALKKELTRLLKSRLSPKLHPLTKLPGKDARIELMSRVIINNFQENTESEDLKQKIETKIKNIASIALDISGLKPVNDFFGHEVGDQYLKNSANALKEAAEEFQKENSNLKIDLFHDSGDEFSIFIEDTDSAEITKEKMSEFKEILRDKLKPCNKELIDYSTLKAKQEAQTRHTLYEQLIGFSSLQRDDEEEKLKDLANSIKKEMHLNEEQIKQKINLELTEEKYRKIKAELEKTFQKSAENLGLFAFLENTEWETNTSFGVCTLEDALRQSRGRVTKKPLENITQDPEGANALAKGLAALMFTTADILGLETKKREMGYAKQMGNKFDKGFAILRERTPDARDNAAKLQEARQKIEELADKLNTCETQLSKFT